MEKLRQKKMRVMSVNYFCCEYNVIMNLLEARAKKTAKASSVLLKGSLKHEVFRNMKWC